MKKLLKNKLIYAVLLIMLILVMLPVSHFSANANSSVSDTDIDANLYDKLCAIKGTSRVLYSNDFNSEKYETITMLGADTVDKSSNITDLSGLTKFRFDYTTTLNVANNSISEITETTLSAFPNLQTLIVSNNTLKSLDISGCYKLKTIIAYGNKLSKFDASDMLATDATLDLSSNQLTSFYNITLPTQATDVSITLNLYNNNITDYAGAPSGYVVNLGLQGITNKTKIQKNETIKYYKTNDNLSVKQVIKSGGEVVKELFDSNITQNETIINLPYGNYCVEHYFIDNNQEERLIANKTDRVSTSAGYYKEYFNYFNYSEFKLLPSRPTYVYKVGNKTYDNVDKITKKCEVLLSADEGTTIYYSVAGGEWQQGNVVSITRGGNYTIQTKAVSGNFESETQTIFIRANNSLTFPTIVLVLFIAAFAVLIFAVAIPLIRKYLL